MKISWTTKLVISLIAMSALFYSINYLIFRDIPFMLRLITLQLGFIPISVILIILFLNRLIANRERRMRMEKLNMVIGNFFTEVGTPLLKYFSDFDPRQDELSQKLILTSQWSDEDFANAHRHITEHHYSIQIQKDKLQQLRTFLLEKRMFLMSLLENPNLLEHESFTDLLSAIFHLAEEFAYRADVMKLPDTDYEHLATDINRAYTLLIPVWLNYMHHVRNSYPYLYSLSVRVNPLNPNASPEVA